MADAPATADVANSMSELEIRARRAWRRVLVAYLVPITVLTHWPRFGVGGAGMVDKFVHFVAFGALAWMAMHAAPRGRALIAWMLAAAWVFIDEVTQALEILGRTFSREDMIAGWIGVAMAGLLFLVRTWRRPHGSRAAIDAAMYGEPGAWLRAAVIAIVASAMVAGAMFAARVARGEPANFPTAVYPIGFGALVGLMVATGIGEWRTRARLGIAAPTAPWPTALAAVPVLAGLLFLAYLGCTRWLFGDPVPDDRATDYEGFLVLREGFLLVAVVLAAEATRAWCTRVTTSATRGAPRASA
jgi:hypothetical protein